MSDTPQSSENESRTNGDFNRAAIKRHALRISTEVRQGKFSRVSEQFILEVEAAIEAKVRELRNRNVTSPLGPVDPAPEDSFLTGAGERKLIEAFRIWIAREIHAKANDVRTGKTL